MPRLVKVSGLLLILWLASACAPEGYSGTLTANAPDDIPTREIAPEMPTLVPTIAPVFAMVVPTATAADPCVELPGNGFTIINRDPCLDSVPTLRTYGQTAPSYWDMVNVLETVDGLSGSEYFTGYAGVVATRVRGAFPPEGGYQFAIESLAGQWGFSQTVDLAAGCYIVKARWSASVVEIDNNGRGDNIGLHPFIGDYDLLMVPFPPGRVTSTFVWPMLIAEGEYEFTLFVQASYATALPGTEIVLHSVSLALDQDGDHCGN